jgi:hypothetical protein
MKIKLFLTLVVATLSSVVFAEDYSYGGNSASLLASGGSVSVVSSVAIGYGGNGYHEAGASAANGSSSSSENDDGLYRVNTNVWGSSSSYAGGYGSGLAEGLSLQGSYSDASAVGARFGDSTSINAYSGQATTTNSFVNGTGYTNQFANAAASNSGSADRYGEYQESQTQTGSFISSDSFVWNGTTQGNAGAVTDSYVDIISNDSILQYID